MSTENLTTPETTEVTTEVVAQPNAKTYEIEYLGEKKEIAVNFDNDDEVKQILQKSLNNDRISEKWESSKTKLSAMEEISRKLGYIDADGHGDIDAMMTATKENLTKAEINQLAEEKTPDEIAEELYKLRIENEEAVKIKEQYQSEIKKQEQYTDLIKEFEALNERAFDPTKDVFPQEVWLDPNKSPADVYVRIFAKEVAQKQAIERKNEENAKSSTGGVQGGGVPAKTSYTREELASMSREEIAKIDFKTIVKSYKENK